MKTIAQKKKGSDNLEWCTQKENNNHSRRNKRYKCAYIDKETENTICEMYKNGEYGTKISKKMGVSQRTVYDILKRNNVNIVSQSVRNLGNKYGSKIKKGHLKMYKEKNE